LLQESGDGTCLVTGSSEVVGESARRERGGFLRVDPFGSPDTCDEGAYHLSTKSSNLGNRGLTGGREDRKELRDVPYIVGTTVTATHPAISATEQDTRAH
jgi:hypothetical protein